MDTKSSPLDYWRKYFRTAKSNIFEVIEYAILVAASDCPQEFRMRRDQIAEKMFSCRLTRCLGCDHVELAVPKEDDGSFRADFEGEECGGKESKVNSSTTDRDETNRVSNYSYDEAEALTEEIEEESQIVGEVLRIKGILNNHQEESDGVLFESLRRLELMALSVETLKATEIGKAVNGVRKHGSKQIRHLARALITWKDMVDEWVNAAAAIAGSNAPQGAVGDSPDSVNPSVLDEEEGLPSPPLDEGAFMTTSIELSQFFDGMDDDGNPPNCAELEKNQENGRKPTSENQSHKKKQQNACERNVPKEDKSQFRNEESSNKQTRPFNSDSGPGRPSEPSLDHKSGLGRPSNTSSDHNSGPGRPSNTSSDHNSGPGRPSKSSSDRNSWPGRPLKLSLEHKANEDAMLQRRSDVVPVQRKPPTTLQDKSKCSDDLSVRVKLEAAKRKLQEGYQQAENAKKQRTIQVMELHDLPKQGLGHRNFHPKPGSYNRNWANGRR